MQLKPLFATTLAVVAGGVITSAVGAGAAPPSPPAAAAPRTFIVIADGASGVGHEQSAGGKKQNGIAAGDTFQSSVRLLDEAGTRIGRGDLSGVGLPRGRALMTGALVLADGELEIQSDLVSIEDNTYAVIGGTGAYAGAGGVAVFKEGKKGSVTVTITIL